MQWPPEMRRAELAYRTSYFFGQFDNLGGILRKMLNDGDRPRILKAAALGHIGKIGNAALGHFHEHLFHVLDAHEAAVLGIHVFLEGIPDHSPLEGNLLFRVARKVDGDVEIALEHNAAWAGTRH